MTHIDPIALDEVTTHYMILIAQKCGERGVIILRELLIVIRSVYENLDPDHIRGSIVIFKTLDKGLRPLPTENSVSLMSLRGIHQDDAATLTLQALDNGQFILWKELPSDVLALSEVAIVYEYRDRIERFISKKETREVPKLLPERASLFATPTFSELKSALDDYKVKMARYSSCPIFRDAWFDEKLIFLKNGPEYILRNSLTHFLKACLRDRVEVRPEQIVDDSHPVDIKVTWTFTNRIALIEIKWLGKSKKADGASATSYTESRARDGAEQLAEYLDMNKVQAPENLTRGYLVVIDARRRTPNEDIDSISLQDGLYYRDREITYDPKYHEIRSDFDIPIRMFAEPLCRAS